MTLCGGPYKKMPVSWEQNVATHLSKAGNFLTKLKVLKMGAGYIERMLDNVSWSDLTIKEFLAELASGSSAPGGGSVAALSGCLAASLVSMVARLTVGHAGIDLTAQNKMSGFLAEATELLDRLAACMDEDTAAFDRVMEGYRMPKATPQLQQERSQAIQQAMKDASLTPLEVAGECLSVLRLCDQAITYGNPATLCDAGVAALLAYNGLVGALFNVASNLAIIKDTEFREEASERQERVLAEASALYGEIRRRLRDRFNFHGDW